MTTNTTRRALENSTLASFARRAAAGSVVLGWTRVATVRARNLVTALAVAEPPPSLQRAIERAKIVGLERESEATLRASFIYRWFTTEPEPEVVVIDLRDTYTVGPVITVIAAVYELLDPVRQSSTAEAAREAYATLADATARSRTGRTIAVLFSPPEPPEERRGRE